VPVANPLAYRKRERAGERDLNRDLREVVVPQAFEDRVANALAPIFRAHEVLVDLHSFRSEGQPFVLVGPENNDGEIEPFALSAQETALAGRLGPRLMMHGWLATYIKGAKLGAAEAPPPRGRFSQGVGTTEFFRFCGGYAVTVECGRNGEPAAVQTARSAVLNALAHLRMVDAPQPPVTIERSIQLVDVVIAEGEGDRLSQPWRNGDAVRAGAEIARRAGGEPVFAHEDGYVVFPDVSAQPGEALFYFAVDSDRRGV
jgi:predicted deacylase